MLLTCCLLCSEPFAGLTCLLAYPQVQQTQHNLASNTKRSYLRTFQVAPGQEDAVASLPVEQQGVQMMSVSPSGDALMWCMLALTWDAVNCAAKTLKPPLRLSAPATIFKLSLQQLSGGFSRCSNPMIMSDNGCQLPSIEFLHHHQCPSAAMQASVSLL